MKFSEDPRLAAWEKEMARLDAGEPPPNHENPPRRHHYVPELYLKRFAARSRPDGAPLVHRIEAKAGPVSGRVIGVRDAAVEKDFYKVDADDPRRAYEAERILGVFETTAGYAFANFDRLGAGHFPDRIDRENLSLFMALQFVRAHDTGDFQERMYTQVSRMTMRVAASTPGYVRSYLIEQGEDASDEAVAKVTAAFMKGADVMSVIPHRNETVEAILRLPTELMPYFFHRRWLIACSTVPFLTTDRPVVLLEQRGAHEPWRGVGAGTAETIVFVLDRYRALLMRHPESANPEAVIDVDARFVRRLNTVVANRARRWIFHHPGDNPLDGVPFNPDGQPNY
jgi:Protein of unknown function (DUF4238)